MKLFQNKPPHKENRISWNASVIAKLVADMLDRFIAQASQRALLIRKCNKVFKSCDYKLINMQCHVCVSWIVAFGLPTEAT